MVGRSWSRRVGLSHGGHRRCRGWALPQGYGSLAKARFCVSRDAARSAPTHDHRCRGRVSAPTIAGPSHGARHGEFPGAPWRRNVWVIMSLRPKTMGQILLGSRRARLVPGGDDVANGSLTARRRHASARGKNRLALRWMARALRAAVNRSAAGHLSCFHGEGYSALRPARRPPPPRILKPAPGPHLRARVDPVRAAVPDMHLRCSPNLLQFGTA